MIRLTCERVSCYVLRYHHAVIDYATLALFLKEELPAREHPDAPAWRSAVGGSLGYGSSGRRLDPRTARGEDIIGERPTRGVTCLP